MIDYDSLAADYATNRGPHPGVLRQLADVCSSLKPQRVLEVGCGTGNYCATLGSLTPDCFRGIDPSAGMLRHAVARGARAAYAQATAGALPFADASFGLAFSVDVIHHVADHETYFREAMRVLRPGGHLCTVTDSEAIIRSRVPLSRYFPETVAAELRRYPPTERLLALMDEVGFGAIATSTVELQYGLTSAEAYRRKAYSSLHLISESAFRRGLDRLEADLARGPMPSSSSYVLLWGTKLPAS